MSKFKSRLFLTTPHQHGKDVRLAQSVLNGANRVKKDFLKSGVDGDWGPLSQQATREAQYWMGFPRKGINGVYGPFLHSLLIPAEKGGVKSLPLRYSLRRRARLRLAKRRAARVSRRAKMVTIAATQIGTTESPANSNRVKYSQWYGMVGPWCAMFVSWCGVASSSSTFKQGVRYAYCPYIEADASSGKNGLALIGASAVEKGDLALFNFGSGEAKHVGLVESIDVKGGTVTCIEGNTSEGDGGSQDNGGGVYRRTRPISHVRRFVRVKGLA